MRFTRGVVCGLLATSVLAALVLAQQPPQREPAIAIEGIDPVLLVQGKEAQGKESIGVVRGNFKYIFVSEENKAAFEKEPERYAVQLNGTCARMGPGVRGNADMWAVHDGKIYLFASDNCQRAFKANPAKFFQPKVEALTATPESTARAKSLLAKALETMGGAEKVDGISTVQFAGTWPGPNGDGEFPQTLTAAFPDRLRIEQSAVMGGRPGSLTFVVAPAESFVVVAQGGGRPQVFRMRPQEPGERQKEFKRQPLLVLRARNTPSFVAVASGSDTVGGRTVELVTTEFDGLRMTLAIEAATGQVLRLSYLDRGPDGFGIFDEIYSDFRTVDGVTLPLVRAATIDGKPYAQRCFKAQSFSVNAHLGAELFQRPPNPPPPPQ